MEDNFRICLLMVNINIYKKIVLWILAVALTVLETLTFEMFDLDNVHIINGSSKFEINLKWFKIQFMNNEVVTEINYM